LVGAAVLVAAAIILIPEILSVPSNTAETAPDRVSEAVPAGADGGALKTYTIDLGGVNSAPGAERSVEMTPAPPAELPTVELPAAPVKSESESGPNSAEQLASATPTTAPEKSEQTVNKAPVVEEKPSKPVPSAAQSADPVEVLTVPRPGKRAAQWAVQVASLDTREKSQKIVDELKSKGLSAFVAASQVNGRTMYRARVGPVDDRAEAETLLRKVKSLHPKATIMSHP
jgi:cell division septation protein DedD